jgi:hypothetical protein
LIVPLTLSRLLDLPKKKQCPLFLQVTAQGVPHVLHLRDIRNLFGKRVVVLLQIGIDTMLKQNTGFTDFV